MTENQQAQVAIKLRAARLRMLRFPLWIGALLLVPQAVWLAVSVLSESSADASSSGVAQLAQPGDSSAVTPPAVDASTTDEPTRSVPEPTSDETSVTSNDRPANQQPEVTVAQKTVRQEQARQQRLVELAQSPIVKSVGDAMIRSLSEIAQIEPDPPNGVSDRDVPQAGDEVNSEPSDTELESVLVLVNPENSFGAFSFLVDDTVVTLAPGESYQVDEKGEHVIRFNRGGEFGDAMHTVSSGTHHFEVTAAGWTLSSTP